jgi:hypothetical protein
MTSAGEEAPKTEPPARLELNETGCEVPEVQLLALLIPFLSLQFASGYLVPRVDRPDTCHNAQDD